MNTSISKKSQRSASPTAGSASNRISKDEMNLVEHPFALLKRAKTGQSVIELEFEKRHPHTGKLVAAHWRVTGDPEHGLPGPAEERLYLVLMELSREQGWPRRVTFSRSDILQRLGIDTHSKTTYDRLHHSFLLLKTVAIDAKRSFWKKQVGDFAASLQFNILDEVELIDEPRGRRAKQIPLALSSFTWSRVLHESFEGGNIRTLNIDFALALDLPLSARLFRYLDKHRTGDAETLRHQYEIELHRLCEIHLGMTPAKYPSKLKERLLPALNELKTRNFLLDWAFEPMKSAPGSEKVVFTFANGVVFCQAMAELASASGAASPAASVASTASTTAFTPLPPVRLPGEPDEEEAAQEAAEKAALDGACDRVFAALPETTRDAIVLLSRESLPTFLLENLTAFSAQSAMEREVRARVWTRFKSEVYRELENPSETDNAEPHQGDARKRD